MRRLGMRRRGTAILTSFLAMWLSVQPVAAEVTWNEAVGWVDFERGTTGIYGSYGQATCTTTSCRVTVPVSRTYFRQLQRSGCTSVQGVLPAGTAYGETNWRTLLVTCQDPTRRLFHAKFYARVDLLDATITTQWITLDKAVTVTIDVVQR
jgi:hypothetical protein